MQPATNIRQATHTRFEWVVQPMFTKNNFHYQKACPLQRSVQSGKSVEQQNKPSRSNKQNTFWISLPCSLFRKSIRRGTCKRSDSTNASNVLGARLCDLQTCRFKTFKLSHVVTFRCIVRSINDVVWWINDINRNSTNTILIVFFVKLILYAIIGSLLVRKPCHILSFAIFCKRRRLRKSPANWSAELIRSS